MPLECWQIRCLTCLPGVNCVLKYLQRSKWVLDFKDLRIEDTGNYTCKVFNKYGQINATYELRVYGKWFLQTPQTKCYGLRREVLCLDIISRYWYFGIDHIFKFEPRFFSNMTSYRLVNTWLENLKLIYDVIILDSQFQYQVFHFTAFSLIWLYFCRGSGNIRRHWTDKHHSYHRLIRNAIMQSKEFSRAETTVA